MNVSRFVGLRARVVAAACVFATAPSCQSEPSKAAPQGAVSQAQPVASAAASEPEAPGRVVLVDAPAEGAVDAIVRDALAKAGAEKRTLLVYSGAKWCEPCQRFHHAAENGELDAVFPKLTLLVFDQDRDGERLASAGYVSRYIPLFALPAANGSASGKQVEGGIKGDGAVGYIVPRLKAMLEEL